MASKRKLSVGSSDDNTANSSNGLKCFLHGITYQFKLILIIFVHAYGLKQKDEKFTCKITSEDLTAGKFDDIVYKYCYKGVSNTVCIQAKHKQKTLPDAITEKDFIVKVGSPYALFPYFKSFLELRQNNESNTPSEPHSSNQQQLHIKEFVLTTNAPIDKSMLSNCLLESVERKENNEMEDFFATVNNSKESTKNTCYKFNWKKLKATRNEWIDILKKASNCCTLAVVLANAIFKEKKIIFRNKLPQFKSAIVHNIVGPARNQEMGIYEINEAFITPNTPETVKFKTEFEEEYKKLYGAKPDFWEDVKTKGIMIPKNMKDAKKLPNTPLPDDEIKDEDVKQFFEQFIIASNTLHEEGLDAKVREIWETKIVAGPTMDLLRSATASENAYANMTQFVLDWMKPKNGKPIDENDIEKIYETIIRKIQFIQLQGFTQKRVFEFKETIIKIEPEHLQSYTIYSQLSPENPESQIFYRSSYDNALVAQIVYETLALLTTADTFKYDYLFLDDKGFLHHHLELKEIFKYVDQNIVVVVEVQNDRNTEEVKKRSSEILNTVAEGTHESEAQMILEDTNDSDAMTPIEHSAEHTITGANEKEEMNKTQEKKIKKVMLIGQTEKPGSEDKFLIKHVTSDTFKELCNKLKDALYFGTKEPLEHITEDDDSLQHLYYIIKKKAQLLSGKKDEPSST